MSTGIDPQTDGVDHINVYSGGATALGRGLSNFAHLPFKHPKYGFFASVEAFWYYVSTGLKHEGLRRLYGAFAKKAGQKLERVEMDESAFHQLICEAITCKIEQHPKLLQALLENTLPLRHYYVYGHGALSKVRLKPEHDWQLRHMESLVAKWRAAENS